MKRLNVVVILVLVVPFSIFGQDTETNRARALKVLAKARVAISGEKKLDGVKTLRIASVVVRSLSAYVNGHPEAENRYTIESTFDFDRSGFKVKENTIEEITSTSQGRSSITKRAVERVLNGDKASHRLDIISGGKKSPKFDRPDSSKLSKATVLKNRRANMLPILFPITLDASILPLKFYYVGIAESDGQKADTIEAVLGNTVLRLFFDKKTKLLLLMTRSRRNGDSKFVNEEKHFYSEYKSIEGYLIATAIKKTRSFDNGVLSMKIVERREIKKLEINPTFKSNHFREL